jgi:hypothetical protein
MTFAAEVTLAVEVEVLDAEVAEPGWLSDRPERCTPAAPAAVTIAVWLGAGPRLDVAPVLPATVREFLEAEALERLEDAAALALLP